MRKSGHLSLAESSISQLPLEIDFNELIQTRTGTLFQAVLGVTATAKNRQKY